MKEFRTNPVEPMPGHKTPELHRVQAFLLEYYFRHTANEKTLLDFARRLGFETPEREVQAITHFFSCIAHQL